MSAGKMDKREVFKMLAHLAAGLVILLKGASAMEHRPGIAALFCAAGVLFIGFAIATHKIAALSHERTQRVLFLLEGVVLFVVSYEMFADHKRFLPYPYMVAAVMYLLLSIFFPRLVRRRDARATHA